LRDGDGRGRRHGCPRSRRETRQRTGFDHVDAEPLELLCDLYLLFRPQWMTARRLLDRSLRVVSKIWILRELTTTSCQGTL